MFPHAKIFQFTHSTVMIERNHYKLIFTFHIPLQDTIIFVLADKRTTMVVVRVMRQKNPLAPQAVT